MKSNFGLNLTTIIFTIVLFCVFPTQAIAGFGVSPSEIELVSIKPGSSINKIITVSSADLDTEYNFEYDISPSIYKSWFTLDTSENLILLSGDIKKNLNLRIDIPETVDIDNYEMEMILKAIPNDDESSGVRIIKGVSVPIKITTSFDEITSLLVRSITIDAIEEGNLLKSHLVIENNGNTEDKVTIATIEIKSIYNDSNSFIKNIEYMDFENIGIGSINNIEIIWPQSNDIPYGEYYGDVRIFSGDKIISNQIIYFKVLENSTNLNEEASFNENSTRFKFKDAVSAFLFIFGIMVIFYGIWSYSKDRA